MNLARSGGIPAEEKQETGREATALARRSLEIHTKLNGLENDDVANDLHLLAQLVTHFNGVDGDEAIRLYEQANAIRSRVCGSLSPNVAIGKGNLGMAYYNRAQRANADNDLDRCIANLELALPCLRESARIYRALNFEDRGNKMAKIALEAEEDLQKIRILRQSEQQRP